MKLRIKGNAVRLRLTQGEVRALAEQGRVDARTEFPAGSVLEYRLCSDNISSELSATYNNNLIEFRIPAAQAAQWCATDQVTVSSERSVKGGTLTLILEKDFACLVGRPGEDESDAFPHPRTGDGSKIC